MNRPTISFRVQVIPWGWRILLPSAWREVQLYQGIVLAGTRMLVRTLEVRNRRAQGDALTILRTMPAKPPQ